MMQAKKGFMLLQVAIGTLIAAVISMVLINTLGQMTKISQHIDDMYEQTFALIMLHNQLERDISGMCVPIRGTIKEEKETAKKDGTSEIPASTQSKTSQQASQTVQQKPIKKVFFAEISNTQQMQQLTFITNNPVPQYWQGTVGSAKPKMVRIIYYLEPSKEHPQSLTLMRQETTDLDSVAFGKDTKEKAYAVASHIASFSLTFSYVMVQEGDKKVAAKPQTAQINRWNSDELLNTSKNEEQSKKYSSLLPQSITIAGTLWNATYSKTVPFSLTIPVLSNGFNAPIVRPEKKNEKPKAGAEQSPENKQDVQKSSVVQVDSMEDAIKRLGGQTDNAIMVMADAPKKGKGRRMQQQAPVVMIPFDHIQVQL